MWCKQCQSTLSYLLMSTYEPCIFGKAPNFWTTHNWRAYWKLWLNPEMYGVSTITNIVGYLTRNTPLSAVRCCCCCCSRKSILLNRNMSCVYREMTCTGEASARVPAPWARQLASTAAVAALSRQRWRHGWSWNTAIRAHYRYVPRDLCIRTP